MKLVTKFDYSRVLFSQENTVHCLISATAPKIDWKSNRKPISMMVALDVSGSMEGLKLDYAKKSVMKLIDHLSPEDRLGVVLFGSGVQTLFAPTLMTQDVKDKYKASVQQIRTTGSTNFSGGMLEAMRITAAQDSVCRIIMFTDGHPNVGVSDPAGIVNLLKTNISGNTSLSAFGYGDDHNSKFLTDLAEIGKGSYAYIKNPDDALTAFARELGGLLSCSAQNLSLTVSPIEGVRISEVLTDIDVEGLDKGIVIKVADIYSEETKHFLLAMKLEKRVKKFPRETPVATVAFSYDDAQTGKRTPMEVTAKISYVESKAVQKEVDAEVAAQIGLCQVNKAQAQAAQFAQQGNYMAAQACFNNLDLSRAGAGVQAYANASTDMYSNAAAFTANTHNINSTLYASKGGRGDSVFTRSVGLSMTNSAQMDMERAFVQPDQNLQGATSGTQGQAGSAQGATGLAGATVVAHGLAGTPGISQGTIQVAGNVSGADLQALFNQLQQANGGVSGVTSASVNLLVDPNAVLTKAVTNAAPEVKTATKEEKKKLNKKRTETQW